MPEEDWVRHAICPTCGNTTNVTVQADVQNKGAFGKVDYPCVNCGTPLALVEGAGENEPDTPVEVDSSGEVINIDALISVAVADVELAIGTTLGGQGQELVRIVAFSITGALEGLQLLAKGAVEK